MLHYPIQAVSYSRITAVRSRRCRESLVVYGIIGTRVGMHLAVAIFALLSLSVSIVKVVVASNSTTVFSSNAFTTDNTNYANIPDKNKHALCRPSNKNKLAIFILDHFNRARVLLKRPAIGSNFNDYSELMLLYKINQFYHFNKRINVFHTAGKIPIGYAQILKCASQSIIQNIGIIYSKGM